MAAVVLRGLVHVALEVDVGCFTPPQHIIVHRCVEEANEAVTQRPQLIQRRCEASKPGEDLVAS